MSSPWDDATQRGQGLTGPWFRWRLHGFRRLHELISRDSGVLRWLPLVPFTLVAILLILFTWQQDVYEWFAFVGQALLAGENPYHPLNVAVILKYGQTGRFGYPPLSLPFFALASWMGGLTGVPFHIILGIESLLILLFVALALLSATGKTSLFYLWLLNPFVLVVALGWKFLPDILMVSFFLLAIVNPRRPVLVGLLLGLSALSKQIVWLFIPLLILGIFVLRLREGKRESALRAALLSLGVALLTFATAILPFIYPFTQDAVSAVYHGLLDPALGGGFFSFFGPLLGPGVLPAIPVAVASLAVVGVWMFYAGWKFLGWKRRVPHGTSGTENLFRFLVWASIPIPLLSIRLNEPHFWLIQLGILAGALAFLHGTDRLPVTRLYFVVTITTYLFFTAQMGFRHLAFRFSPWPAYGNVVIAGLNVWQWLWVIAVVSLGLIAWAYLRAWRIEGLSFGRKRDVTGNEHPASRFSESYGPVLLLSVLAAVALTGIEMGLWLGSLAGA